MTALMETEQQKQQPISLKLCLYNSSERIVERSFSRDTTLLEVNNEIRKVFNIDSNRETRLWINNKIYHAKPEESIDNGTKEDGENVNYQLSDVKENNSCNTNGNLGNSPSSSSSSSSPLKPPPTPPPMPANTSSSALHNNSASPNVITRQAAQSLNKQQHPIALTDGSESFIPLLNDPKLTLLKCGLDKPTAVVTIEVINNDGTWPGSKPRFGLGSTTRSSKAQPGLCGLSNLGNTCFMNSALQCLSNTPPLTDYILTDKFVDDINTNNPLGMHGEIARTYAELIKVMWSGNHTSFLPREFKCAVSRFAPQFTGFAQQDCQELMAFLLDGLHEDLNRIKNKPYIETKNEIEKRPDEEVARESWENYKKRNDSIVVDTFHAMLKSTLICPECKLVSVTFDPFCYLSLPLPVKREKQVTLTFLPAPAKLDETKIKTVLNTLSKEEAKLVLEYGGRVSSFDNVVEEHAGYPGPSNRPKGRCKMQVPRSGPASELCEVVARIINEERTDGGEKVQADNLVVAEMAVGRISKIYESSEHYNQISDDIVIIEKASNYAVPVYVREDHDIVDSVSYALVFVHVPDLKYETLYQSIIVNLSNLTSDSKEDIESWCKLAAPTSVDEPMDCDEVGTNDAQDGDCNGTSTTGEATTSNGSSLSHEPAFKLVTVNSFGNNPFETLMPSDSECDSSKLYLGATFILDRLKSPQFEHNRAPENQLVEMFTPKVSPKPTLQLKDCITQFTNAERLGADDPWYCPKCKKHQQAIKKFDVWSLPKVLIIHLKRFSYSRSWRDKIDTLVEFPVEGLDMSSYVHNPEQKKQEPIIYDLIGVANHTGGLGGGHYNAYAKNATQDSWYIFDDALVSPTNASHVVTRSAYVLFYRLREDGRQ